MPLREKLQDFFAVIANSRQLDPLLLEPRYGALQLDQLPFAERSPVRGTEKKKNGAVRSFQALKCLYPAKLIVNRKSGRLLTDRQPNRHQLGGSHLNRIAIERSSEGYRISQMSGYSILAPGTSLVHSGDSAKASSALQLLETRTPDHDPAFVPEFPALFCPATAKGST